MPQSLRVSRQRKLRIRVVHYNNVTHRSSGCASSDHVAVDHGNPHPALDAFICASGAHDSGAHNRHVIGRVTHARMPLQNGSCGSSNSSACEFTKAEPVMLGYTRPSITLTLHSNTLPTMLSCRHTSPSRNFPSAKRHASFALVPVPQGERSYALPGHKTKFLLFTPGSSEGANNSM